MTTRPTLNQRLRKLVGPIITECELLQKYTLGAQLGTGGSATVYSGRNRTTGRKVALKMFDKASMINTRDTIGGMANPHTEEKAVTRVRRRLSQIVSEIEVLEQLDHPNLIEYIEGFETSHRICLVFELVEGSDLFHLVVRRKRLPEVLIAHFLAQVMQAMQYCHSKHIYHRDLKLENILVTKDNQIKVIDFGLAQQKHGYLRTMCGTPLYCSPEMLFLTRETREIGYDGAPADVWSIGVIGFALATGCAPFDDSTLTNLRQALREEEIYYNEYLSDDLRSFLSSILTFQVEDRPSLEDLSRDRFLFQANAAALKRSDSSTETESITSDRSISPW